MRSAKLLLGSLALLAPAFALAQDAAPKISPTDSVWMIVATALVLLMTPALALFYGGMVSKKNVLNTMMLSFIMMGVVSLLWVICGYSLAFGNSPSGFIGSLEYALGNNVSATAPYGTQTIPALLFMLFQMKFAIITPALISGAIAERVRFNAYTVFMILWSLLVYVPIACWVWNPNGWLLKLGALDYAGGTVVHLASGISALALCLVIGARNNTKVAPNNLTLTLLGAGLLWFGWFGFNAGSALAINDVAINSFLTTHMAAAAAMMSWLVAEYVRHRRMTAIGAASGLVAGLVVITPAAGFVTPGASILMGLIGGVICQYAIELKHRLGFDDALDVVAVHGVGGFTGAVLTGVFATASVNSAIAPNLEKGQGHLILMQLIAAGVVLAFGFIATWVIAQLVNKVMGLRSHPDHEELGLDTHYHGEAGYGLFEEEDFELAAPATAKPEAMLR